MSRLIPFKNKGIWWKLSGAKCSEYMTKSKLAAGAKIARRNRTKLIHLILCFRPEGLLCLNVPSPTTIISLAQRSGMLASFFSNNGGPYTLVLKKSDTKIYKKHAKNHRRAKVRKLDEVIADQTIQGKRPFVNCVRHLPPVMLNLLYLQALLLLVVQLQKKYALHWDEIVLYIFDASTEHIRFGPNNKDIWDNLKFSQLYCAIDGKHITIQGPSYSSSLYFNYSLKVFFNRSNGCLWCLLETHSCGFLRHSAEYRWREVC